MENIHNAKEPLKKNKELTTSHEGVPSQAPQQTNHYASAEVTLASH